MTFKIIRQDNRIFLLRWSFPIKSGTIKVHVILNDDTGEMHTHPWNFSSLLVIPYKEELEVSYHGYFKKHHPFCSCKERYISQASSIVV